MLKLSKTNTITLPVTVRLPTDDAGKSNEGTLNVRYTLLPREEVIALNKQELTDREYIERVVVGVEGLGNDEGQPISGADALAAVLDSPWSGYLQLAILEEYFTHFGQARVKNSRPSRGR